MKGRALISFAIFTILSAAHPQEAEKEPSDILQKIRDIEQRLERVEREMKQLREIVAKLPEEKGALDVRQTPEYQALKKELDTLRKGVGPESGPDPAQMWQAMGNPEELAKRLDALVKSFAPTLSEEKRREEFLKDVVNLKEKIGKKVPDEEIYKALRERISERISQSPSEREKAWLKRQLDVLEKSTGKERKEHLDRYVRIENIRALHDLAEKYSIPREQMVKSGLAFIGYPRRPPGQFGPPGGERRPKGPPPKQPRSPREDRRRQS